MADTYTIRPRRGTAAQWTSANPVLALAEEGYETDTRKTKHGNGTTPWNALNYDYDEVGSGGGAGTVTSVNGDSGPTVSLTQGEIPGDGTAKQFTTAEQSKLSGITSGATANATDAFLRSRGNHTGTQAIDTVSGLQTALDAASGGVASVNGDTGPAVVLTQSEVASDGTAKQFTTAEQTKLTGIAASATANATNAQLRDRTTHTGEQAISTVTGLQQALDSAGSGGGGGVASVNGDTGPAISLTQSEIPSDGTAKQFLTAEQTKLNGITAGATANSTDAQLRDRTTHTGAQAISTVTGLQTALDAKVTTVNGEAGPTVVLTQGEIASDGTAKQFTTAEQTKLGGITTGATANATDAQLRDRTTHTGSQAISTVTNLQTTLDAKAPLVRTVTVAYSATVTPNADTTDVLNIGTLTGPITLANPTGTPTDGKTLRVRLAQDPTGGRAMSFGGNYAFGTDVTTTLIPASGSTKWEMLFGWHAGDSKWRALSIARGF